MKHLSLWLVVLIFGACATGDRGLQLISGQGPIYPPNAKVQQLEGDVVVRYDVTIAGLVENARVVSSEPAEIFDAAALAAVRSWRFNAPVVAGEKQAAANRESSVAFRLSGTDVYDEY